MGNKEEERDYKIIKNAVNILSITCCANPDKIIELLTGYLWDEEEVGEIKRSSIEFPCSPLF